MSDANSRPVERTLFLHIGPPKTGTTAIQMYFRDNAEAFREQGFYRPGTGTEGLSHLHRGLVFAFEARSGQRKLLDRLAEELRQHGRPSRVFISAEFFASRINQREYAATIKQFCAALGYRLHVIAYLRPQAPLLNSLFTQSVKNWRAPESMEAFLSEQLGRVEHDYSRLFATLLGDAGVIVSLRPFNKSILAHGIIQDVTRLMGLDTDGLDLIHPAEANVSPGSKTIEAFRRLGQQVRQEFPDLEHKRLNALTRPLVRAAGALGWNGTKFGGITGAQQNLIENYFRRSNEDLARRAWSAGWQDVFSHEECRPPLLNVFDPAEADIAEREEFGLFIAQSLAAIREFVAHA